MISWYYPDATDDKKFREQVKEMIMAHADAGFSILNQYNRERENKIRDDKRDWEAATLPLLTLDMQKDSRVWGYALTLVDIRNSYNDPEIAKALQKLLMFFIQKIANSDSEKGTQEYKNLWNDIHSLSIAMANSGNPDLVNHVFDYAVSERERKLGLMNKFNYEAIMEGAEKCPQKVKPENFGEMVKIMVRDDLRKDGFYLGLIEKAKAMEKSLEALDELPVEKPNEKLPSE